MKSSAIGVVRLLAALLVTVGAPPLSSAAPATGLESGHWQALLSVSHPSGLAIDLRGDPNRTKWAYTLDYMDHKVIKFGTGGRLLLTWRYSPPTHFQQGGSIAVDGSGNVFVADADHGRVLKFDPSGHELARWTGFHLPSGIAVGPAGNVYVSEGPALQVTKLSPSGNVLTRWHTPWVRGAASSIPAGIAVDQRGTVYVAVRCFAEVCPPPHGVQEAVLKFSASGDFRGALLGGNPYVPQQKGWEPFVVVGAITVDRQGRLYVTGTLRAPGNSLVEGILVYRSGSRVVARYEVPGEGGAGGIAVDGKLAVYITQDDRILKRVR